VADTFDAAAFCGYRPDGPSGHWTIAFPTLESYRDDWLRQAASFAGTDRSTLSRELYSASTIADIEVTDDRALIRKEFDGVVQAPTGPVTLAWITYYFMRREADTWLATGFVGAIPLPGRASPATI
jgi:hypothetical protein